MNLFRKLLAGAAVAGALAAIATLEPAAVQAQGKKAIEGKGTGTLKGKIKLNGTAPAGAKLKIDQGNKDAGHCGKGDTEDETWVSKDGGLGNVVVFLKAPAGSYFKVDTSKKDWPEKVEIDQPFCAFKPHVSVMFPEYEGKPTGQKLIVKNSAPILHNSRVAGSSFKNPAKGETLAAGATKEFALKADTQAIKINCDAHKWMEAYIWAFDHPFAAVTKADGTFEIKNVPLGVDLAVMAWHEVGTPAAGVEVKKGQLKDGDTIDFSIMKK
jgi:hypothetical protein